MHVLDLLMHLFLQLPFPCGKCSAINTTSCWEYESCYYVLEDGIAGSLFKGDVYSFLQNSAVFLFSLAQNVWREPERCNIVIAGKVVSFLQLT